MATYQMPVQTGHCEGLHLLSGKHATLVGQVCDNCKSINVFLTLKYPDSIIPPLFFDFAPSVFHIDYLMQVLPPQSIPYLSRHHDEDLRRQGQVCP